MSAPDPRSTQTFDLPTGRMRRSARPAGVARTHVGAVRSRNEDRFLARPEVGLWAVADGMGGHSLGDVASGLLVDNLSEVTPCGSGHALLSSVKGRLAHVNRELRERARTMAPGAVMGSTIVVLVVFDGHCAFVWAGDSRGYRLRRGRLERMTTDHRMVQRLVDAGAIAASDASGHPWANVITRAVGADETLEPETHFDSLEDDDIFLLASDGLTDVLDDGEISRILADQPLDGAADALLALALARGAPDNVTFVLTRV